MAQAYSTASLLRIAGTTRDVLNKIRPVMQTAVPSTTPGVAREWTRENVLEVAFIIALSRLGLSYEDTKRLVYFWVVEASEGRLAAWWFANPSNVFGHGLGGSTLLSGKGEMTVVELAFMLSDSPVDQSKPAASLLVVNRGEIVRRVDEG